MEDKIWSKVRDKTEKYVTQWIECIKESSEEVIHMDINEKGLCFEYLSLAKCTFLAARRWKEKVYFYLTLCPEFLALNVTVSLSSLLSPPLPTNQKSSQTSFKDVGHAQKGNYLLSA